MQPTKRKRQETEFEENLTRKDSQNATQPPWHSPVVFEEFTKVDSLDRLIQFIWKHRGDVEPHNFDWERLWVLLPILTELKSMIGLRELKMEIVNFILYYVQNFHLGSGLGTNVIMSGPSGCGKTRLVEIIGKMYAILGLTETDQITTIRRDKLPQTLPDKGIVFLDNKKTIGSLDRSSDDFGSVLSQLEGKAGKAPIIFACDEDEMERYLFSTGSGMGTIFSWHFSMPRYSPHELLDIFKSIVSKNQWSMTQDAITQNFFSRNSSHFTSYGRDVEELFMASTVSHSRRVFGMGNQKKILTSEDIKGGYEFLSKKTRKFTPSYFG